MIENLLNQLAKLKPTGPGRWLACCPSHQDCSPSLSIRQIDDGRILIHCFAGCAVHDILGAVGMTMEDLFPERLPDDLPRIKRPYIAADVLEAIAFESLIVSMVAVDMLNGKKIEPVDNARLQIAVGRIRAAADLALGPRKYKPTDAEIYATADAMREAQDARVEAARMAA